MKKCLLVLILSFITNYFFVLQAESSTPPMYICTAASSNFFPNLINMIGSLFRVNFDELEELAIFDIGLKVKHRKLLEKIEKVKVYGVELTHPDLLKPVCVNRWGKMVPGWYAWKPVIMKQSLDMFPYVLYMDAGTTILNPLNDLFKHIIQNGYFLTDCAHDIKWMTPQYIIKKFNLYDSKNRWILNKKTLGIDAGLQGVSRSVYDSYVLPMYEFAKDINNFIDDGTTPNGFGTGRHDQTLFSIIARLLNMKVHIMDNGDGRNIELQVQNKKVSVHITWNSKQVHKKTVIFHSRNCMPKLEHFKKFIRFKNS